MSRTAEVSHPVTARDTASALGSGDLPVLATPRLVAWCEAATCAALELPAEQTSVGTRVEIEHLAASAIDTVVTATATVVAEDGRRVTFEVAASDESATILARGTIQRAVVDRARFMARVGRVGD